MRSLHRMLAREAVICGAFLSLAAALPGCSAGTPADGSSPAAAVPSTPSVFTFTVAGVHPVVPSASQDTHAQTPEAGCDAATFAADKVLGSRVADGFAVAGFPAAAGLLTHFLRGKGTPVHFGAGSALARKARSSSAFRAVNQQVQEAVLHQLRSGRSRVRLTGGQLPTVAFASRKTDLYWGFRGTQGLSVTGAGHRENARYTGTLTYVIRDSYGFPPSDTLGGLGPPMGYLQTACGAPQHPGGAHWFPDTITVTVPFSQPARQQRGHT